MVLRESLALNVYPHSKSRHDISPEFRNFRAIWDDFCGNPRSSLQFLTFLVKFEWNLSTIDSTCYNSINLNLLTKWRIYLQWIDYNYIHNTCTHTIHSSISDEIHSINHVYLHDMRKFLMHILGHSITLYTMIWTRYI